MSEIHKCEKEMLPGGNQNSVTDVGQIQDHLSGSKETLLCGKNSQVRTDLQDIQNFNVTNFQKIRRCEKKFGSCESRNSVSNLGPTHDHPSNLKQNSVCDKNMQILTDLQQIQNSGVASFQRTNVPLVEFHPCSQSPINLQQNIDDLQSVKNFNTVSDVSQDCCAEELQPTQGSVCQKHVLTAESVICDKNSNLNVSLSENESSQIYLEKSSNVNEECSQEINDSSVSSMAEHNATKSSSDENFHILNDLQQIQNLGVGAVQQRTKICQREFSNSPATLQQNRECLRDFLSNKNIFKDSDSAQYCSADLEQSQNSCHQQHDLKAESKIYEENSDSAISSSENVKPSEPYTENLSNVNEKCDQDVNGSSEYSQNEAKEVSFSGIFPDVNSNDSKRIRRNNKRKRDVEEYCPVCGLTVRNSELESHFAKEVESLSNIAKNIRKPREKKSSGANITFVRVKCNRENRLAAKVAKYSKKNDVQCPVCKMRITGSESEINEHVLNCTEEEDSDVNILDHDDSFEEYEIGNETRVRAISFVPGGYRSLHGQSSTNKCEDVDDDLNVDIDDTSSFGQPQYTELDIIHNKANGTEDEDSERLRRAVVFDPTAEPHVIEGRKWSQDCEITDEVAKILSSGKESLSKSSADELDDSHATDENSTEENVKKVESDIISSLKERIRDLEQQKNVKCLICLEPYTKPVVATTCWHVHCEECWLVTMGVKKLCPQCNTIVFPTNLRRIYL